MGDWRRDRITILCQLVDGDSCTLTISPFDEHDEVLDDLSCRFRHTALSSIARNNPLNIIPPQQSKPFQYHESGDRYFALACTNPLKVKIKFIFQGATPKLKMIPIAPQTRFSALLAVYRDLCAKDNLPFPSGDVALVKFGNRRVPKYEIVSDYTTDPKTQSDFSPDFDSIPRRPVRATKRHNDLEYTVLSYSGLQSSMSEESDGKSLDEFFEALRSHVRRHPHFSSSTRAKVSFLFFTAAGVKIPGTTPANSASGRRVAFILGYVGPAGTGDVVSPAGEVAVRDMPENAFKDASGALRAGLPFSDTVVGNRMLYSSSGSGCAVPTFHSRDA
jgi:hypothetical protein